MPERVIVDRIEGEVAVLTAGPEGAERLTLPRRLLPEGAGEGAALDLTLSAASDDRTREEIDDLMGDLFGPKS